MSSIQAHELKPYIIQALDDGSSLSVRWIYRRLQIMGVKTTTYTIRVSCKLLIDDGKLEIEGRYSNKNEYRLVAA